MRWVIFSFSLAMALLLAGRAGANGPDEAVVRQVHLDQRAGQDVPIALRFMDDDGRARTLESCIDNRPTILVCVYFKCPNLCPMLLRHLIEAVNGLAWSPGRDLNVIVTSIDPSDTPDLARQAKKEFLRGCRNSGSAGGWHFLVGDLSEIECLKQAVGFSSIQPSASGGYIHPLGVIILSGRGKITHTFRGVDFSSAELQDALHDASAEKMTVHRTEEQQYCLDYQLDRSRHGKLVVGSLRVAAVMWIGLIGGYIGRAFVLEYLRSRKRGEARP